MELKRNKNIDLSVYFITNSRAADKFKRTVERTVMLAVMGGATVVQLRDKKGTNNEVFKQGKRLLRITRTHNIPLIINDRILVAIRLDADGVHIGQSDMNVRQARQLIGDNKILGVSVHTLEQALYAQESGADYVSVSPVFSTRARTKPDADTPVGLKTLELIVRSLAIPVIAIGGIGLDNSQEIIKRGGVGVAVVAAIATTKDPGLAAQHFKRKIKGVMAFF